jgi:FlaA1/EpsC-like NDP-sugar epimerase
MYRFAPVELDDRAGSSAAWRGTTQRHLPLVHFAVDAVAWVLSVAAVTYLRFDFNLDLGGTKFGSMALVMAAAVATQGGVGYFDGLYRRRWRYGSFDEVIGLAVTVIAAGLGVVSVLMLPFTLVPRSVPVLATPMTLMLGVAARSMWRLYRQRQNRHINGDVEPIVVVGAGDGAEQIVRLMLGPAESPYIPVALVDDDPDKQRLSMFGVRVKGTIDALGEVAAAHHVTTALLAIPTADSALIRRVDALATAAGLKLLVLPPVRDMLGEPGVGDIHPLTEADLLGRETADVDTQAVASYVTGKRVLVTGAGGSIGSELCRQLRRFDPAELVMLDRDEGGLHAVQLSLDGHALLDDPHLVLASIRDPERMREIFARYRPQVVFHAAALKHLSLLEATPTEAWKTNVVATHALLELCTAHGVERMINISTDKAADPISVLGYSKRVAERLTAHAALGAGGTYVSVRFGNVLGSRGSVIPSFRAQVEAGGPITVTDPDVTRYFMTIEEAVRLTIYAGAIGRAGEVLVLDMGEPVRILDVARRFANQTNPPVEIVFTGLRPGEKMQEMLLGRGEVDERPIHPLISHASVPPMSFDDACAVLAGCGGISASALRCVAEHGMPWAEQHHEG